MIECTGENPSQPSRFARCSQKRATRLIDQEMKNSVIDGGYGSAKVILTGTPRGIPQCQMASLFKQVFGQTHSIASCRINQMPDRNCSGRQNPFDASL